MLAGRGGGEESREDEYGVELDERDGNREEKDTVRDGAKSQTNIPTSTSASHPPLALAGGGGGRMMNFETPRAEDWAWSCGRIK